ncbi:MAG TPA: lytic transglycosylase F [Steroidobacteraceae bacterium]|jgi:membrane-bound lytic murein transglycosylase MltF
MNLSLHTVCSAGLALSLVIASNIGVAAVQSPAQAKAPAPARKDQASAPSQALNSVPWTGDFDGMVDRRLIRVLTPYSKTLFFIDKGVPRGIINDAATMLEKTLNAKLKTSNATKVHVVVIPTSRDALYDALVQGRGDIIAAGVTVTPEREKLVDFTVPTKTKVKEIVVTGPGALALASVDDLAGKEIAVREGSIEFDSLQKLNATFKGQGKAPVRIRTVPATLEDEDILEMTNAGLLKVVVVSDLNADFWMQILPSITPHPDVAVREEGALAWAVRKNSPKLIAVLNPIIKANGEGTLFGNSVLRTYLKDTKTVKRATSPAEIKKFNDLVGIFRKYGDKYSLDYLLMMAQGFQESRLDQSVKSKVGAIGVMQVMPATGKELKVGDIGQTDPNIEAGVKYMRFMMDQYYKDEPMDNLNKGLFTFASYNAGPARIRQMRSVAADRGLNRNVWFNNVERVVGEKIGRETVTYVSSIYKYYVAYALTMQELDEKAKASAGAH